MEFNSDRKRMSILLRDGQDGHFKLYCKGADNIIKGRLLEGSDTRDTDDFLLRASQQGYRTLLVAMKVLEKSEVDEFLADCAAAEADLGTRKANLEKIYDQLERDLYLLGATVVEDQLQDEVPETISALHRANIKVWVLTGDKLETAESIGFSSKLLTPEMSILRCRDKADV